MSRIADRIDRLPSTPMLRNVLLLLGIGWMFDAMDQGMVAGVMAAIGTDWALTKAQLGVLSSSGMLGMALGAALSGMASDRWGRKRVVAWTLVIYGCASILSGFAVNYAMLVALRFVTGFGLGGELPAASTLVSEFSPTKIRGRNVIILESFWAWGWIAAALVAYLLIPYYGWRMAFWVGGLPALFAAVLRKVVPESPRFLEEAGRYDEADALVKKMEEQAGVAPLPPREEKIVSHERIGFIDLWRKRYIRATIVLWVIWFGINFGYYGFVLWTPTLLMGQGYTMVKSFEFTLIMCLAQLPGYFSAALLIERIGRKKVLSIYFLGTAVAAWLFGHADSSFLVVAYGCLLYFFSLGAWGCVYAYTPEMYPTAARGTGTGWASAFGRVGAFIAPLVVPVVYGFFGEQMGFTYVFIMMTAVFAFVAVVVALFGQETMGKSLEEINQ